MGSTVAACGTYAGLLAAAWLAVGWAGRTIDRRTARRELVRAEDAAIARAKATYQVGNARENGQL
jgi:hypothetical protein